MRTMMLSVIVAIFGGHSLSYANEQLPGRQVESLFETPGPSSVKLGYLLYLPKNYGKTQEKFPLLLFLHGAGERGNSLPLVKKHGPPKLIDQGGHMPFVVVSPQCPEKQFWDARLLLKLLDHLESKLNIDPSRVYVTGLSMGGMGTWALLGEAPERFAAAVPICGLSAPGAAPLASRLPVWIVVGDKDRPQLVANAIGMENAITHCGGDVKLSIYTGVGHDSWTQTYAMPELYEWMLRHKSKRE